MKECETESGVGEDEKDRGELQLFNVVIQNWIKLDQIYIHTESSCLTSDLQVGSATAFHFPHPITITYNVSVVCDR